MTPLIKDGGLWMQVNMNIRLIRDGGSWLEANTGKGKFISRLIPALESLGARIVYSTEEEADIDMQLGYVHYKPVNCKKFIVRMGPPFFSTHQNYRKLNKPKTEAIKQADGVIYQSQFGKKLCDVFLGKAKRKTSVIFNGSEPKVDEFFPNEHTFLASAREWLPQKRLKDIVESFLLADIPYSQLIVAGQSEYGERTYKNKIRFLGKVDDNYLKMLYKTCTAMIHIVWLDVCPNSVVEALTAGCPVICNNQGGTHELVKIGETENVLMLDDQYRMNPVNLEKPPKIDRKILANKLIEKSKYNSVFRYIYPELQIQNIAKQYLTFFEEVLHG